MPCSIRRGSPAPTPSCCGPVQLRELPTNNEIKDTIVAFWTSEAPLHPGQAVALSYQLAAIAGEPAGGALACAIATRVGNSRLPGAAGAAHARRVLVDFA